MKTIFIDTSAFYALLNRDDPHHQEAAAIYQNNSHLFVTTHTVFTELLSLLTKRHSKAIAVRHGKEIRATRERLRIVHLDESQCERAWDIFCKFKDKDYDLADCLSFICMKDQDIREAFAYDKHFTQYGLEIVTS
ncbi:MAG: PIN domain-containing protein [Deltaproteobacteria bacterium]|nr:PIN domain-containing protein [Deltaproteobacteria bacterium]